MITVVTGTRPECIKLGPVVAELRALGAAPRVLLTGQHRELLAGTPAESDLAHAESLGLASDGRVLKWLDKAERALRARLSEGVVVVQGDTMSAAAGARAATAARLPLVHVEAGVRSRNLQEPWPEEGFRVEIDALSDWHLAATTTAYANLVAEGHAPHRIVVTGNSVVSALARYTSAKPSAPSDVLLVTLHRRELLQSGELPRVLEALSAEAAARPQVRFIWPMHPAVAPSAPAQWLAALPANFTVCAPLPYREAARVLAHALGVLTDSGGLVEEAATLGVPSVQLRNVSDRPEAIEAGVSVLSAPTPFGVQVGVEALCSGLLPRRPTDVYGDVGAAGAIARAIVKLDVGD